MPRKVRPTPKAYISDFTEGIDEEENAAEGRKAQVYWCFLKVLVCFLVQCVQFTNFFWFGFCFMMQSAYFYAHYFAC